MLSSNTIQKKNLKTKFVSLIYPVKHYIQYLCIYKDRTLFYWRSGNTDTLFIIPHEILVVEYLGFLKKKVVD